MNLQKIKLHLRWLFLCSLVGAFSGLVSGIFLILLHSATEHRESHMKILYLLPLAGIFINFCYVKYWKTSSKGNNLILDEIHDPKNTVPLRMAPLVLFGTIITHLFGGSAGREGTAVQMGATLADQVAKFFKVTPEQRKILLTAGMGAGFGAAIGAPWAGVIFGMEVLVVGRMRFFAVVECFIATFVGFEIVHLLGAPHTVYPLFEITDTFFSSLIYLILSGVAFGLAALCFSRLTHFLGGKLSQLMPGVWIKPLIGGLVLLGLYTLEGSYRYDGLGLAEIIESLQTPAQFLDPLYKLLFTSWTLSTGFKGGEFTPLVFIGSTLGSALGTIFPVSFKLLAALGFAAVFGAASNTPIACTIMAIEIFGLEIGPYALITCYVAYLFSGHKGIYSSQLIERHKFLEPFKKKS